MTEGSLGNDLYRIVSSACFSLFDQGELAQLTYGAFDIAARTMHESELDEIEIKFPIGWRADKQAVETTRKYKKDQLLGRYHFLAFQQLSINGLVQLVTIIEAMFGDVVRKVVMRYPQKLGAKRSIPFQAVMEATSIQELHLQAADALLHDLSYKAPAEFADALKSLLTINLWECPAFHKYVEIKASRDIYIHNRGVANEIYARKAGMHLRVKAGMNLPIDVQYFLESYESCIQLTEWLERELHQHWHSSDFEAGQQKQLEMPLSETPKIGESTSDSVVNPNV